MPTPDLGRVDFGLEADLAAMAASGDFHVISPWRDPTRSRAGSRVGSPVWVFRAMARSSGTLRGLVEFWSTIARGALSRLPCRRAMRSMSGNWASIARSRHRAGGKSGLAFRPDTHAGELREVHFFERAGRVQLEPSPFAGRPFADEG